MNKKQICLVILSMGLMINGSWAAENFRHDSGLVGPGHYAKSGQVTLTPEAKVIAEIQKKNEDTLKTDVALEDLDKFFCNPTQSKGYAQEIFDTFKGTQGENTVLKTAQDKLPEGKVLAIHKFQGDKTEEGMPVQLVLNATVDRGTTQKYEAQTTVVGEKSGFKFTFKQTINLLTGEKPKISLVEEEVKKEEQAKAPSIIQDVMHVAIYSDKQDIPTSTGTATAIRHKFTLDNK